MTVKITALENGPYMVEGGPELANAEGSVDTAGKEKLFLCRCGHSANKPFCDGAHKDKGFTG